MIFDGQSSVQTIIVRFWNLVHQQARYRSIVGYVGRLTVTYLSGISANITDSYQIYFNTDAVLVLTDALLGDPSPLLFEQNSFLGRSFRSTVRTVVRRATGLIILCG